MWGGGFVVIWPHFSPIYSLLSVDIVAIGVFGAVDFYVISGGDFSVAFGNGFSTFDARAITPWPAHV